MQPEQPRLFDLNVSAIGTADERTVPVHGEPTRKIWLVLATADRKAIEKNDVLGTTYGHVLQQVMNQAGIRRDDLHICTINPDVVSNYMQAQSYRTHHLDLHNFVLKVEQYKPDLIIAVGESALNALTDCDGLDKWRGSFVFSKLLRTTVLPIYGPFRLFWEEEMRGITIIDLKKIAVRGPAYREPQRQYVIDPRFDECMAYLDYVQHEVTQLSVDIETFNSNSALACIGFSDSPYQAFVIPFARHDNMAKHCWTPEQDAVLMLKLNKVLSDPKKDLVYQNAMFDKTFLWERMRIFTAGSTWDTMVNHHLLYPDLRKNLGLLTSIYTLDPYYKDEGKVSAMGDMSSEQFWTYNAKDADTTLRIHRELVAKMKRHGYWDMAKYYKELYQHIWVMSVEGINVDQQKKRKLAAEADIELDRIINSLHLTVGFELNPGSPKQMAAYLYDELGLPEQKKTVKDKDTGERKKVVSADKKALLELRKYVMGLEFEEGSDHAAWKTQALKSFAIILEHRKLAKMNSTYYKSKLSPDGRIRSEFSLAGPDTGRFASSMYMDYPDNPGVGANLQNQTGLAKSFLIPDDPDTEGPYAGIPHVWVNMDLMQAEARVVAYVSDDPGLKYLLESGMDYHSANAMNIWNYASIDDVTKHHRQLAKVGGHATNYDISSATLAISLGISLREAQEFHRNYFAAYPQLRRWQNDTKNQILKLRRLTNLFGRERAYMGKLDEDTLRSGLAYVPQSTVSDLLNRALMRFKKSWPSARLRLQCHDSLLFSCPITLADEMVRALRLHTEVPIVIKPGREFTIPCSFEIGYDYYNMIPYLTPEEEGGVREALLNDGIILGRTYEPDFITSLGVKISHELSLGKDAVIALASGRTWRR